MCRASPRQAPAKTKIGDDVWLRGGKGSKDPFVPAKVTNVQQNGWVLAQHASARPARVKSGGRSGRLHEHLRQRCRDAPGRLICLLHL